MPGGNPAADVRARLATATAVNLGMGSRAGPRSEGESRALVMATPGCVEVDGAAAGQPRPDVEGKRTVCELRGAADAWQANHSGHRPEARHPAPNLDASEGHRADRRVEDRSPNGSLGAAFGFGSWITHSSSSGLAVSSAAFSPSPVTAASSRRRARKHNSRCANGWFRSSATASGLMAAIRTTAGPWASARATGKNLDGLSHGALRGDARRHGPAPSPAPIRDATPAGGPSGWSPAAGNG